MFIFVKLIDKQTIGMFSDLILWPPSNINKDTKSVNNNTPIIE